MIEFVDVKKRLDSQGNPLRLRLNFTIPRASTLALYGPSGAGKTSTLRMLAGLLRPDSGRITVDQKNWFYPAQRKALPPGARNLGFVFQDYGLFPHMTVRENLAFALPPQAAKRTIDEHLAGCALVALADRPARQLSGGQRQRVAVARTLVQSPDILLLDEPFSAQDDALRDQVRNHLRTTRAGHSGITVLVTHHLGDIFALADLVLEIGEGKILRRGTPAELFLSPVGKEGLRLRATVLRVGTATVLVTVQGQTIAVTIPPGADPAYRVGDTVYVTFGNQGPVLAGKLADH